MTTHQSRVPISDRIAHVLRNGRSRTVRQIAQVLGHRDEYVRDAMSRDPEKFEIVNTRDRANHVWRLRVRETVENV